mmetsp:Transcript_15260/g.42541  ORF Transcript_15260/g.42541 Transcript_15260/m.42541 type:complete len:230 (+) Transcript_15260:255-944(+)
MESKVNNLNHLSTVCSRSCWIAACSNLEAPQDAYCLEISIRISLVRKNEMVNGGLKRSTSYLGRWFSHTGGWIGAIPSLFRASASSRARFSTTAALAYPPKVSTAASRSGSCRKVTRGSSGFGDSSTLLYLDGKTNAIVPGVLTTGAVIATCSPSLLPCALVAFITGAVIAIFSPVVEFTTGAVIAMDCLPSFFGSPKTPMYFARRRKASPFSFPLMPTHGVSTSTDGW